MVNISGRHQVGISITIGSDWSVLNIDCFSRFFSDEKVPVETSNSNVLQKLNIGVIFVIFSVSQGSAKKKTVE